MSDFLQYLILGITRGSMYALIALGYTLVYGVLQLINFAHSEVFMSGAFGSFLVVHAVVGNSGHLSPPAVIGVILAAFNLLGRPPSDTTKVLPGEPEPGASGPDDPPGPDTRPRARAPRSASAVVPPDAIPPRTPRPPVHRTRPTTPER